MAKEMAASSSENNQPANESGYRHQWQEILMKRNISE
jgi:hypothetical protein